MRAEGGVGMNQAGILPEIAGQFPDDGIVQASHGHSAGPQRVPIVQIVPNVRVKIQIGFEQKHVIRKRS